MKAFPNPSLEVSLNGGVKGWQYGNEGMDLRDYFAAKVMQSLLATVKDEEWDAGEIACIAYNMAESMLVEREGR